MDFRDKVRGKLKGTAPQKARRQKILDTILAAAGQGGPDGVSTELQRRLDELERELVDKLAGLKNKLAGGD
jgi:hypothetical protein